MPPEQISNQQTDNRAKKLGFFKTAFLQRPTWCSWQLTDTCNFRCKFCSVWKKRNGKEQTLEEIEQAAINLTDIGTLFVSMTGGEPLTRQDLPEIIQVISHHHFTFITTNGSLVTATNARAMAEAGLWGVGVSLDYADEKRHDAARGQDGAFRSALKALELLQANRVGNKPQVNIMITLMRDNLEDIPKLAELATQLGCSFLVQPYSTLKTGDTSLNYPRKVSKTLLNLRRQYPNFMTNRVVLEKFDQAISGGVPGCVAGRYMLNIDPRGNVSICPESQDDPVGHILQDDIKTILKRLKEKHRTNTCQACWYNCRNEIESMYTMRGFFYKGVDHFCKR